MNTKQLYLEDFDVTSCNAIVVKTDCDEYGEYIVLNQTCFHPKGGGQDFDLGTIKTMGGNKTTVKAVLKHDSDILHYVDDMSHVEPGAVVICQVDIDRRALNTKLHSAGHLIDVAMSTLRPTCRPGKGAHYPHMSFVEYSGEIDLQTEKDRLLADLQQKLARLQETITEENTISLTANNRRSVSYGGHAIECGGTHVRSVSDIGEIGIKSIKRKNGAIRISYVLR